MSSAAVPSSPVAPPTPVDQETCARTPRMRRVRLLAAALATVLGAPVDASAPACGGVPAAQKSAPARPCLILHADDLGLARSADLIAFRALERGDVSSASAMVPAPWFPAVAAWARLHPAADLGVHLTLTSEWNGYSWGPVAPRDQVPSLVDDHGYFWPDADQLARLAVPAQVERELCAQIDRAIAMGLHPTHLDCHMGVLYKTPALLSVLVKVAHRYCLPFLAVRTADAPPQMRALIGERDLVLDSMLMATPEHRGRFAPLYAHWVAALRPGVYALLVHLGASDQELSDITAGHPDYGARWREEDRRAVTDPAFKAALRAHAVRLVGWKDLVADREREGLKVAHRGSGR